MRYDPCGRAVDVGRRPYRTACRPWRDSSEEVTVHWYVVPPENGTLPYPSRINSLCWRDAQMNPSPVGEVSAGEQFFDGWGRIVPPIPPGDHICGTREDFELGGLRNTDEPPLTRGPDGIPTCCRGVVGGVVLGGEAVIPDIQPTGPGGGVLAGEALYDPEYSAYQVTSTDPLLAVILATEIPLDDARQWWDAAPPDWTLESTEERGTAGDWTLRYLPGGQVWEVIGWNGIGSQIATLVSGSWAGVVTITLDT